MHRRKTHGQPARQPEEDRKSILLWRSPLDSPDKKRCPLKSWSKRYEEARMVKKSQIIWHKWGKLPFKKKMNRGFVQPWLSQGCLVSLALSKFRNTVDMPLSFILMQIKNCTGSNTITPTRPPAGSKMKPMLSYSNLESDSKTRAGKTPDNLLKLHCIPAWIQCCFYLFPYAPSTELAQNGEWGGKGDGQSLSGLQLPPSHQCHVMKPSAPFP